MAVRLEVMPVSVAKAEIAQISTRWLKAGWCWQAQIGLYVVVKGKIGGYRGHDGRQLIISPLL
jgi:hypothetical protein